MKIAVTKEEDWRQYGGSGDKRNEKLAVCFRASA
jgi:hypothetical protein